MNDTEDNPSSSDAVARQERQARRQAIYKERAQTPEGREYSKRVANRLLKNTGKGQALLSGGSKPKVTLSKADYISIFAVAGFFDVLSFLINLIPVVGGMVGTVLVTLPGGLIMRFMYTKRGIDFNENKRNLKFFGSMAIELTPVLSMLPGFILNVVLMLGSIKAEEVLKKGL